jgi:hypothetical protein
VNDGLAETTDACLDGGCNAVAILKIEAGDENVEERVAKN